MPRYTLKQQDPKSCGAACTVVAERELGTGTPTAQEEVSTYAAIRRTAGESDITRLVNRLNTAPRSARLVEDTHRTGQFLTRFTGLATQYGTYLGERTALGHLAGTVDNVAQLPAGHERRLLVVMFPKGSGYATHYVLARLDGGRVWIMNPDGPSDTAFTPAEVANWMTGSLTGTLEIGTGHWYVYTGIQVVVD